MIQLKPLMQSYTKNIQILSLLISQKRLAHLTNKSICQVKSIDRPSLGYITVSLFCKTITTNLNWKNIKNLRVKVLWWIELLVSEENYVDEQRNKIIQKHTYDNKFERQLRWCSLETELTRSIPATTVVINSIRLERPGDCLMDLARLIENKVVSCSTSINWIIKRSWWQTILYFWRSWILSDLSYSHSITSDHRNMHLLHE